MAALMVCRVVAYWNKKNMVVVAVVGEVVLVEEVN